VLYRPTHLGRVVPFVGIGPRVSMLRSTVSGSFGGVDITKTTEQSTNIGVGLPLGVELSLGPGGLVAELLLPYGKIDHIATGSSNTNAATLGLGYRATF